MKSREEGVRESEGKCEGKGGGGRVWWAWGGVVREVVRGETEACGPSKFSIPRISRERLQVQL